MAYPPKARQQRFKALVMRIIFRWWMYERTMYARRRSMIAPTHSVDYFSCFATVHRIVALLWVRLPPVYLNKKDRPPKRVVGLFGGAEGSRTPVRRQLGRNFSGCSLLFTFPHSGGNKHPTEISSFMMRGARKA